jgi:hypothetical protein
MTGHLRSGWRRLLLCSLVVALCAPRAAEFCRQARRFRAHTTTMPTVRQIFLNLSLLA